jgi:replicative DNA helicase
LKVKVPPNNIEAEQSILGGLLLDREAWDQVADQIISDDFYKPSHQIIFNAITDLQLKNQAIDVITLSAYLQSKGSLEGVGGSDYIIELINRTISSANIAAYCKLVKDAARLRNIINTSTGFIEKAYDQDFPDVDSFIDQVEAAIFKLNENKTASGLTHPMDIVKTSIQKIEELTKKNQDITGIATGFKELDKMTSGMQPGELLIIAARPSMGKTAFSLNIAQHIALRQNKGVAYFSLEMGKESLMMRILASEAKISMSDLRSGRVPDAAWRGLISTASTLSSSPLFIDDTSGISPFEVRARCRRLKAQHGLDCIMIDYLQLMQLKQRVESREREVSEISKTLKAIAKELQVPVIALAQLNRGVEGRADRRPMLSDLRESGSIEQDADVIMMLYREDYYEKDDAEKQGHAEIIIGKQRNGPTGTVKLKFEAKFNRFKDAEPEAPHSMPGAPSLSVNQGSQFSGPSGGGGRPRNFAPGAGV